jgi:hypothetical protein
LSLPGKIKLYFYCRAPRRIAFNGNGAPYGLYVLRNAPQPERIAAGSALNGRKAMSIVFYAQDDRPAPAGQFQGNRPRLGVFFNIYEDFPQNAADFLSALRVEKASRIFVYINIQFELLIHSQYFRVFLYYVAYITLLRHFFVSAQGKDVAAQIAVGKGDSLFQFLYLRQEGGYFFYFPCFDVQEKKGLGQIIVQYPGNPVSFFQNRKVVFFPLHPDGQLFYITKNRKKPKEKQNAGEQGYEHIAPIHGNNVQIFMPQKFKQHDKANGRQHTKPLKMNNFHGFRRLGIYLN